MQINIKLHTKGRSTSDPIIQYIILGFKRKITKHMKRQEKTKLKRQRKNQNETQIRH